jgi:hypothetical protein
MSGMVLQTVVIHREDVRLPGCRCREGGVVASVKRRGRYVVEQVVIPMLALLALRIDSAYRSRKHPWSS